MKNREDFKDFGEWLKELREAKGWSEAEVAEKIELPRITEKEVKKWERDVELPDLETIYKLSEIYSVLAADLLIAREKNLQLGISGIPKKFIKLMNKIFGISFYSAIFLGYAFLALVLVVTFLWFVNIVGQMV